MPKHGKKVTYTYSEKGKISHTMLFQRLHLVWYEIYQIFKKIV